MTADRETTVEGCQRCQGRPVVWAVRPAVAAVRKPVESYPEQVCIECLLAGDVLLRRVDRQS